MTIVPMLSLCRSSARSNKQPSPFLQQSLYQQQHMKQEKTTATHWDLDVDELLSKSKTTRSSSKIVATLAFLLKRCGQAQAIADGRLVHAHITRHKHDRNTFLGNWLIFMYGECGSMEEARAVFDKLPNPNLHSWTMLMKAYVKNDLGKQALECFHRMQVCGIQPNRVTFIAAVDACASTANIEKGQELHAAIRERGYEGELVVATALVSMYGKCGSLEDARIVFNTMPHRNVVSWTAMIDAWAKNGHGKEALDLFNEMQAQGIKPNQITFLCALDACSSLAALEKAREVHASIVKSGCKQSLVIDTALVNMYGKCGSLKDARFVFAQMSRRDVVSWNTMIAACAQNGHGKEALDLFHQMRHDSFEPNHVTFLNILSACSHMGRVDDGRHYFASMSQDYGITPKVEHYLCLIDMLGRAGSLDAAEDLINSIPFKNEASVWLCLLGACRVHGDLERGIRAANHALEFDPERAAPYLLLSNIYASSGRPNDPQKRREVWKNNN